MIENLTFQRNSEYDRIYYNDRYEQIEFLADRGVSSTLIDRQNLHPTGHRVLTMSGQDIDDCFDLTVKGYQIPPVLVFGQRAESEFDITRNWKGSGWVWCH